MIRKKARWQYKSTRCHACSHNLNGECLLNQDEYCARRDEPEGWE